jgi:hypothetical protein
MMRVWCEDRLLHEVGPRCSRCFYRGHNTLAATVKQSQRRTMRWRNPTLSRNCPQQTGHKLRIEGGAASGGRRWDESRCYLEAPFPAHCQAFVAGKCGYKRKTHPPVETGGCALVEARHVRPSIDGLPEQTISPELVRVGTNSQTICDFPMPRGPSGAVPPSGES